MKSLLKHKPLAKKLNLHPGSLSRMVREGRFPRPFKLTDSDQGEKRYDEDEVEAWLEERKAAAEGEAEAGK